MNRFLLFAGKENSEGGWWDFKGAHATLADASKAGFLLCATEDATEEWWHVIEVSDLDPSTWREVDMGP